MCSTRGGEDSAVVLSEEDWAAGVESLSDCALESGDGGARVGADGSVEEGSVFALEEAEGGDCTRKAIGSE